MRSGSTWPPCRLPPRAESRPGSAQGSRWGQAGSHAPLRAPPAYLPHHLAASARHGPSPGQGRRRFRSRGVPAAAHGRAVARSRRGPLARIALHDHWLLTNHSRANLRVSRMKEAALLYTGGSATPACRLTNAARRVVPPRPELRTAPLVSTSTCLLHDPRSSPRVPASTSAFRAVGSRSPLPCCPPAPPSNPLLRLERQDAPRPERRVLQLPGGKARGRAPLPRITPRRLRLTDAPARA